MINITHCQEYCLSLCPKNNLVLQNLKDFLIFEILVILILIIFLALKVRKKNKKL